MFSTGIIGSSTCASAVSHHHVHFVAVGVCQEPSWLMDFNWGSIFTESAVSINGGTAVTLSKHANASISKHANVSISKPANVELRAVP